LDGEEEGLCWFTGAKIKSREAGSVFFFLKGGSNQKRKMGKSWGRLLEAVRGEEGGGMGGDCFFIFLREEGLRLRKRNEFRVFYL
jgi:hypothetical protein